MRVTLFFACGHAQDYADRPPATGDDAPQCELCGERQVANVRAPRPRFRGDVQGPCVVEASR